MAGRRTLNRIVPRRAAAAARGGSAWRGCRLFPQRGRAEPVLGSRCTLALRAAGRRQRGAKSCAPGGALGWGAGAVIFAPSDWREAEQRRRDEPGAALQVVLPQFGALP
jgi:hypothetical protein